MFQQMDITFFGPAMNRLDRFLPDRVRTPMRRMAPFIRVNNDDNWVFDPVRNRSCLAERLVQRFVTNSFLSGYCGRVASDSMFPTYREGDIIVFREFMYLGLPGDPRYPRLFDIVNFWSPQTKVISVKRVLGLPGQDVEIGTVPPKKICVLGDNTGCSLDSRYYGFLPIVNILGIAYSPRQLGELP